MRDLSNREIDAIERALCLKLPGLYRKLLVEEGYGMLDDRREIYDPRKVRELYEPYFDDPRRLFAPYFPFGCDNRTQELWVIDAVEERAASIRHETVPDDWPDERWLEYDEWVLRYLDSESSDNG